MAKCANCEHSVPVHSLEGCSVGFASTNPCDCPFDYDSETRTFNRGGFAVGAPRCKARFRANGWEFTRQCLMQEHREGLHVCAVPGTVNDRHAFSDSEALKVSATKTSARDAQIGGDHYSKHKIQPWDIWEDRSLGAFEGSIIKYILRYKDKNGVEDLKKARHTLDRLIEIEEARSGEA